MNFILSMTIQWSASVKYSLIAIASLILLSSVILLVREIIGRKRENSLLVSYVNVPAEQTDSIAVASSEAIEQIAEDVEDSDAVTVAQEAENIVDSIAESIVDDATLVRETFFMNGQTVYVRYNRSFIARLRQSDEKTKENYSTVKNNLLAYGAKPRMSWTCESFRVKQKLVVKLAIKGKTLSAYIALDPNEYADSKYIFEDVSETKKFAQTPLRMKLRSSRGAKWAKELIADLMATLGVKMAERPDEIFDISYQSTEQLVAAGLIKVYVTGNGSETEMESATFEALRREKFRQLTGLEYCTSVSAEDADRTMTNEQAEALIEAEDDIKKTVSQPLTPSEEPSEQNENSSNETTLADCVAAEEDETAEKVLPAKQRPSVSKKQNKAIINIDTISDSFNADDEVNIDALKEKKLISSKSTAIKILARGFLNKPLTVIADDYSMQAVKMILLTGGRVVRK